MTACGQLAQVTYRATSSSGREVEVRLTLDPAAATVADAWSRLTGAHPSIDPMSLEIEIRRIEPAVS